MTKKKSDDDALWERVKQTITPLKKDKPRPIIESSEHGAGFPKKEKKQNPARQKIQLPGKHPAPEQVQKQPIARNLDLPTHRKIAKGKIGIDATIDLHGSTQSEAHRRLKRFLEIAQASGNRTILVITGKGIGGEGVLRQMVPFWLQGVEFRSLVSGFNEASAVHGGGGALYVRVKRSKNSR